MPERSTGFTRSDFGGLLLLLGFYLFMGLVYIGVPLAAIYLLVRFVKWAWAQ